VCDCTRPAGNFRADRGPPRPSRRRVMPSTAFILVKAGAFQGAGSTAMRLMGRLSVNFTVTRRRCTSSRCSDAISSGSWFGRVRRSTIRKPGASYLLRHGHRSAPSNGTSRAPALVVTRWPRLCSSRRARRIALSTAGRLNSRAVRV